MSRQARFQLGLLLLFVFLSQSAAAATRDQLIEGAKKEGEIVLYASMNVEEANAMIARFSSQISVSEGQVQSGRQRKASYQVVCRSQGQGLVCRRDSNSWVQHVHAAQETDAGPLPFTGKFLLPERIQG
jgi:hypothetical protein